ncbi:MAG: DNA polymerase III subunit gamma/tau [Candidatus Eremiobacteraeota bacterium]|nr:DNA polymerase III subunit gamma/tau [Candidatus Eremiobacteraeota bacterium]
MSLYRSWRPKTFADLVGQDAVVRTLSTAISSGKLAHAYLFSGPRGSGKTSAAKIFARCINCVSGPTPVPDNTCANCVAMLAGNALDVLEIDAASNRGIDEIRALRDAVRFPPSSMRSKVYIVDEAHMLTKEGANAFLKTLEEPPPHAVFVLATTEPEKLPPTILSRCQRYAFRRIAIPIMIDKMREIALAEEIAIDDEALGAIAYRADGGLRDALTMLEQAAAFGDGSVNAGTIDLAFGATGRNYARAIMDGLIERDANNVLRIIDEASDAGSDMHALTRNLTSEFRHLLVARVSPDLLARDLAGQDAQHVVEMAQKISQALLIHALRLLTEASYSARSSGNPRLELESALLRFVLAGEDPTVAALSARVSVLEGGMSVADGSGAGREKQAAAVRPKPGQNRAPNNSPLTLQKIRSSWQNVRARVEGERMPLRAPLSRALLESLEGDVLTIKLAEGWMADALRDHLPLIVRAVTEVVGVPVNIALRIDGNTGGHAARDSKAAHEESPEELLQYARERIPGRS